MNLFRRLRKTDDPLPDLGHLESAVLEALWASGESNVRELALQLDRPLAYTTVMTTLDRLYKKGLLDRRKVDKAYVYAPRFSRLEWERKRAGDLIANLLGHSASAPRQLVSHLVEAVEQHDRTLLDELERRIAERRRERGGK